MPVLLFLIVETVLYYFSLQIQIEDTGKGSVEYNKMKNGTGRLLVTTWILFILSYTLGLFI